MVWCSEEEGTPPVCGNDRIDDGDDDDDDDDDVEDEDDDEEEDEDDDGDNYHYDGYHLSEPAVTVLYTAFKMLAVPAVRDVFCVPTMTTKYSMIIIYHPHYHSHQFNVVIIIQWYRYAVI